MVHCQPVLGRVFVRNRHVIVSKLFWEQHRERSVAKYIWATSPTEVLAGNTVR